MSQANPYTLQYELLSSVPSLFSSHVLDEGSRLWIDGQVIRWGHSWTIVIWACFITSSNQSAVARGHADATSGHRFSFSGSEHVSLTGSVS